MVGAGTDVRYCFTVTNTGATTLTRHDLFDDQLGTLLVDFAYTLSPGTSAFLTEVVTITETVTSTATWTASNPDLQVSVTATDSVTVTVESSVEPTTSTTTTSTTTTDPTSTTPTTSTSSTTSIPSLATTEPPSIDPEGMGMTSPGQQLPATGASPSPWLWFGVALLAVGTASVMLARKKEV